MKDTGSTCCTICLSENSLHLHHKTYKRLGKESDRDLVLLCSGCHKKLHKYFNRVKKKGISLFEASDKFIIRELKKFESLVNFLYEISKEKQEVKTLSRINSRGERVEIANKELPKKNTEALKSYLG